MYHRLPTNEMLLLEEQGSKNMVPKRVENMSKVNTKNEQDYETNSTTLVGYVRKSNAGRAVKLSINTSAFQGLCNIYYKRRSNIRTINREYQCTKWCH